MEQLTTSRPRAEAKQSDATSTEVFDPTTNPDPVPDSAVGSSTPKTDGTSLGTYQLQAHAATGTRPPTTSTVIVSYPFSSVGYTPDSARQFSLQFSA